MSSISGVTYAVQRSDTCGSDLSCSGKYKSVYCYHIEDENMDTLCSEHRYIWKTFKTCWYTFFVQQTATRYHSIYIQVKHGLVLECVSDLFAWKGSPQLFQNDNFYNHISAELHAMANTLSNILGHSCGQN